MWQRQTEGMKITPTQINMLQEKQTAPWRSVFLLVFNAIKYYTRLPISVEEDAYQALFYTFAPHRSKTCPNKKYEWFKPQLKSSCCNGHTLSIAGVHDCCTFTHITMSCRMKLSRISVLTWLDHLTSYCIQIIISDSIRSVRTKL